LSSGDLTASQNIHFIRPVDAEEPKRISDTFHVLHEWYQVDSLQIELKIFLELYDSDSFETAEKIGGCTYCDTFMVHYE